LAENYCLAILTFRMKHIMSRATFQFLDAEFVCSIDIH